MRIKRCTKCSKYSLKEECNSCKNKTREVTYKFKQPKNLELTIKGLRQNAHKKGKPSNEN